MFTIEFDEKLIKQYQINCPRYTSYPTAVQFKTDFNEACYREAVKRSNNSQKPLSLYFHLPFCRTICYFCACNKWGTKDYSKADLYLDTLTREIALQADLFDVKNRLVKQIHWGGGTPNFLSIVQMQRLMTATRQYFKLASDSIGEYGIEVHPNFLKLEDVPALRALGFNRVSMGIQDFDPKVQRAVNRVQDPQKITDLFLAMRQANFKSISVDLMYGLPFQTVLGFQKTLSKIIELSPDRIVVFNYAHLPKLFKPQKQIKEADLPSANTRLKILQTVIKQLTEQGYVHIGMDHFAKQSDELACAQEKGTLHRTFQGYTTHAECDLIGMGVTAISQIQDSFAQNDKTLEGYDRKIQAKQLATFRGVRLTQDDHIRKAVIMQLACHFKVIFSRIEMDYKIVFKEYFKTELANLILFQQDGLVCLTEDGIVIMPKGRLLVRNICSVFDYYFNQKTHKQHHAKAI